MQNKQKKTIHTTVRITFKPEEKETIACAQCKLNCILVSIFCLPLIIVVPE